MLIGLSPASRLYAASVRGTLVIDRLTDEAFERFFGLLMIPLIVLTIFRPKVKDDAPPWPMWLTAVVFFGIGLYAGSHSSYKKFNKLFDRVIEEYHGHGPDASHVSCMESEGLENAEFSEEDAAMVNSTRIRVGRNLADYPLGPGVTKEQRLAIMDAVVKATEVFDEDLKGTFYPLEGMDKATQDQLINDHFLFK